MFAAGQELPLAPLPESGRLTASGSRPTSARLLLPDETVQSLRAQYAHWQLMAQLKEADDRKPGCSDANPW